jgi:hypothetical protein
MNVVVRAEGGSINPAIKKGEHTATTNSPFAAVH